MLDITIQKQILYLKQKYSIYAPFADKDLFNTIIEELAQPFQNKKIDKVLGLEARGFILGAPVAHMLRAGFVVGRKKGKLYNDYTEKEIYSGSALDYSNTVKTIEIENNPMGIQKGDRVLIVDDWFETGGQGSVAVKLVEEAGGIVAGISIMLDDMKDEIRSKFTNYHLNALVVCEAINN